MSDIEALRAEWTTLYSQSLPNMAKSRDPAQPKWPVTLDHCFARIILDNAIGNGQQQWDKILPKPAVRTMNERQLRHAIELGQKIKAGEIDLCFLDEASLRCRRKNEGKYGKATLDEAQTLEEHSISANGSRKRTLNKVNRPEESTPKKSRKTEKKQSTLDFWRSQTSTHVPDSPACTTSEKSASAKEQQPSYQELKHILNRVQSHPSLTSYRKKLYTILLSVPRGRYTTYAAMSDYLKSSARAVGNGIRNNPLAPEVPCHRVLAADGSIGGFQGDWGRDGKFAAKKIELLRSEGVRFGGSGKVVGEPFRKFHEFQDVKEGTPV